MNTPPTTAQTDDFAGRVAIVTGASRALGAATARTLARDGAAVALVARDHDALDAVAAQITADGGRALVTPADCTDPAAVTRAVDAARAELGPVELLAAFAGGNGMPQPTEQLDPDQWRSVIDSDLTSVFFTIRAVLPSMLAQGRGAIVTMSSSAGRQPGQANAAYAAAKAGVAMLTRHLAAELGPRGIRANCLAPSAIVNEKMLANTSQEQRTQIATAFPLGRLGQPTDIAAAATFLLSDQASWITGVTLDITGGRVIV
jgi:3-oxoacyl-[acyl-carrier protein] reductase